MQRRQTKEHKQTDQRSEQSPQFAEYNLPARHAAQHATAGSRNLCPPNSFSNPHFFGLGDPPDVFPSDSRTFFQSALTSPTAPLLLALAHPHPLHPKPA